MGVDLRYRCMATHSVLYQEVVLYNIASALDPPSPLTVGLSHNMGERQCISWLCLLPRHLVQLWMLASQPCPSKPLPAVFNPKPKALPLPHQPQSTQHIKYTTNG